MNRADSIEIPAEITRYLGEGDLFQQVMHLQGKAFRDVRGRKTIQVKLGNNSYFIKQHFGVGWAEIFKNLLTLRMPILGAKTEKLAIQKLDEIGIATTPLVAFGEQGCNPAKLQSFLITKDLGDIVSLEELCATWKQDSPTLALKRRLIIAVAELARKLHQSGMNHRDFYLCHLCLDAAAFHKGHIHLYLIDLHRMRMHQQPDIQDNMKDMAALYFSSMDVGLSARDYLRFRHYYANSKNSKNSNKPDAVFWQKVITRANKLYAKFHSDKFQNRLQLEKNALNHD
ncbi:MAG TPA: lipopolysaccharide core heptose(I) kinase RfaP [Methylotenera sp.]|nr:lipopolysaccharide core heptose(I) kinase RfaP [Methylotenera sp.]